MDDKTLIEKVMEAKNWNQKQVAEYIGQDKSLITRVLRYGQKLQPAAKKLLELLLK